MQKKWKYGILGYVFLMIGSVIGMYLGILIMNISHELFEAYILGKEIKPDDLFRYSQELHLIFLCGMFTLTFIVGMVIFLFINALLEEETTGDRKEEEKIEPYYYEILGVSKDASLEAIKKAYRDASLQFHQDVNKENDAREKFIMIKKAYETLSDSDKREEYDRRNRK